MFSFPLGQRSQFWFFWPVLVSLAVCAGYLAVANQYGERDLGKVRGVTTSLAALNKQRHLVGEAPRSFVIQASQLLPSMALVQPDLAQSVGGAMKRLADELREAQPVSMSNQIELQRQMLGAESQLRAVELELYRSHTQNTHYFYLSLGGVVLLSVIGMLRSRGEWMGEAGATGAGSPFQTLMKEAYLFPNAPLGMSLSDADDKLVRVNGAFETVTGFEEDEVRGQAVFGEEPDGMRRSLQEDGVWVGEHAIRRKDGSMLAEKVMRVAVGSEETQGYLTMSMEPVVSNDERRLMLWQAHHDNLTKLPNANLLHERLSRAIVQSIEGHRGALISIDIDDFQKVNDAVGHELADRVLMDAAYRIAMCARETDTVARVGGDLFVIALLELDNVAEAEQIARAAVDSLAPPFFVEERELFLSASAGVTIFPDDGHEKGELLQKADAARLQAKKEGGNRFAFFEEEMNSQAARRLEIETHLRRAIEGDELELHFQPVIDVQKHSVYGAEALLRWHSDALGFVSPAEFIPVAETSGLIVEIGQWVVHEVQRQVDRWNQLEGWPDLRISLNVSAMQFVREDSAQELLDLLSRGGSGRLTVELTESALVNDDPGAALFLQGLKERGFMVALDDFGTGYSSIGYLRDFHFDILKIDKSFIDGIESVKDSAADYGLVASIIAMGRILGMRIVAEGVENGGQAQQLKQIGCDYIQGYHYSKPLPVAEFEAFVMSFDQQNVS